MNVLYLGKDKPHATERYVQYALEQYGLTVNLVNIKSGVYKRVEPLLDQDDLKFVLFSKPHVSGCNDFLELCRQKNVPTVCWQWDLYYGLRGNKPPQFNADHLFTTDGGHRDAWEKHYPHHQVLRQGIHSPHCTMVTSEYEYDVAFVGSVKDFHSKRRQLITHLMNKYGSRFQLIRNVRGLDLNHLLSRVKVVVGDSYPAPYYWSNRIYEILGRGGFLLHPRVRGLEQEFTEGVHYGGFEYGNLESMQRTLDYYLQHDEEREAVKHQGHRHVGRYFTYTRRVQTLLRHVLYPLAAGL